MKTICELRSFFKSKTLNWECILTRFFSRKIAKLFSSRVNSAIGFHNFSAVNGCFYIKGEKIDAVSIKIDYSAANFLMNQSKIEKHICK